MSLNFDFFKSVRSVRMAMIDEITEPLREAEDQEIWRCQDGDKGYFQFCVMLIVLLIIIGFLLASIIRNAKSVHS